MTNIKYKTERQARNAAQRRTAEWQKKNTTTMMIRFNNEYDCDVLAKLASVENRTDYIRKLIRADIVQNGFEDGK